MRKDGTRAELRVPTGYPTSMIYVDESGAKATGSNFFVVAAAKVRASGKLARAARAVRDRTGFTGEFKFSEITRGSLPAYYELIDRIEESDLTLTACVVDRRLSDPFSGGRSHWRVHADIVAQTLVGAVVRNELVTVLIDGVSTPADVSLEDVVRRQVNRRLGATKIVGAACLDSRSNDCLQIADLLAGAVAFERRRAAGVSGNSNSNKAKVAGRVRNALGGVEFCRDVRTSRVNIKTFRARGERMPRLRVLPAAPVA